MLLFGTKARDVFKAWTKADKEAQTEAVKRLGLPANNTAADRATAMGFGDDVYHGTKTSFDEFSPDKASRHKSFFTAPEPWLANKFSGVSPSGKTSELLFEQFPDSFNPQVMPLKTRGKVFDYENPEHIKLLEGKIGNQSFGVDEGAWYNLENKVVQEGIKDLGFDGFNVLEEGVKNTGTHNPANIRSKFAHFNPKMAGVGAGSILSADLMADELDLEHKPKVSAWDSLMNTISGVNQQQAQAYGDTGAGAFNIAGDVIADPSIVAELGIKGARGSGLGMLLQSNEVGAAENPDFFQQLQNKRVR